MSVMDQVDEARHAANEDNSAKCVEGEYVYFVEAEGALAPGHIYSKAGVAEFNISHLCEYHFDKFTREDDW